MSNNYPPGVTAKDFDDVPMTEWEPLGCSGCGREEVLDEDGFCESCFESEPIIPSDDPPEAE